METRNKPATPLPWSEPVRFGNTAFEIQNANEQAFVIKHSELADVRYIAHAANAYPKLVEALRDAIEGDHNAAATHARALLRKLGEAE